MNKIPEEINFSTILFQELVTNTQKNLKYDPSQRKHNEIIKKFHISFLFMAGPSAHDFFHKIFL